MPFRPSSIAVPASRRAWFPDSGWVDTPVVDRAGLASQPRTGPLIVQEYDATCLVPRGVGATLDAFGNIRLTRAAADAGRLWDQDTVRLRVEFPIPFRQES